MKPTPAENSHGRVQLGPVVNALCERPGVRWRALSDWFVPRPIWRGMDPDRSGLLVDLLRGKWSLSR